EVHMATPAAYARAGKLSTRTPTTPAWARPDRRWRERLIFHGSPSPRPAIAVHQTAAMNNSWSNARAGRGVGGRPRNGTPLRAAYALAGNMATSWAARPIPARRLTGGVRSPNPPANLQHPARQNKVCVLGAS